LSHLVREAALAAIEDGSEKITKALLASIQLDVRAQTAVAAATQERRGKAA